MRNKVSEKIREKNNRDVSESVDYNIFSENF